MGLELGHKYSQPQGLPLKEKKNVLNLQVSTIPTGWARLWLPAGCLTMTVTALCEGKVLQRTASLPLPSPCSTSSFSPPPPYPVFCACCLLSAPQTQQLRPPPLHLCHTLRVLSSSRAEDTQESYSSHWTEPLSVCALEEVGVMEPSKGWFMLCCGGWERY